MVRQAYFRIQGTPCFSFLWRWSTYALLLALKCENIYYLDCIPILISGCNETCSTFALPSAFKIDAFSWLLLRINIADILSAFINVQAINAIISLESRLTFATKASFIVNTVCNGISLTMDERTGGNG